MCGEIVMSGYLKLINSNRYFLNVLQFPRRFLHLATIQQSLKEYICLLDVLTHQCYIEEMPLTNSLIEEELSQDIERFLYEKGILGIKPALPDKEWLKAKRK
jgi:hypothetical protein